MSGETRSGSEPETAGQHNSDEMAIAAAVLCVGESVERPTSLELHQRIIDPKFIPQPMIAEGQEAVEVAILGSQHVRINGNELVLTVDEVFALNALLLLRSSPASPAALFALGYRAGRSQLSFKLTALAKKINTAADERLIFRTGKSTRTVYNVDPRVRLFAEPDPDYPQEPLKVSLPKPRIDRPTATTAPHVVEQIVSSEGYEAEEDLGPRERAILAVVRQYADHPSVVLSLARHMKDAEAGPGARLEPSTALFWIGGQFEHINDKAEMQHIFADIDKGIAVYEALQGAEAPAGSQEEAALIRLVYMYQRMYVSNLKLVGYCIAKKTPSYSELSYEDMYIEGSLGLSRAICKYNPDKAEFSTIAMHWIRQSVSRAVEEQTRVIRLPSKQHQAWVNIIHKRQVLEAELHRPPSNEELANATDMKREDVQLLLLSGQTKLPSLDQHVVVGNSRESYVTLGDAIPDTRDFTEEVTGLLSAQATLRKLVDSIDKYGTLKAILTLNEGLSIDTFGDGEVMVGNNIYQLSWLVARAEEKYGPGPLSVGELSDLLCVEQIYIYRVRSKGLAKLQQAAMRDE